MLADLAVATAPLSSLSEVHLAPLMETVVDDRIQLIKEYTDAETENIVVRGDGEYADDEVHANTCESHASQV